MCSPSQSPLPPPSPPAPPRFSQCTRSESLSHVCILKPELEDLLQARCGVWDEMDTEAFVLSFRKNWAVLNWEGRPQKEMGCRQGQQQCAGHRHWQWGCECKRGPDSRCTVHFLWEILWAIIGPRKAVISTQRLWWVPPHLTLLCLFMWTELHWFHLQFCP